MKDSTGEQKFVLSLRKFTRLIMFLMKNNSMKLRGKTFYFFWCYYQTELHKYLDISMLNESVLKPHGGYLVLDTVTTNEVFPMLIGENLRHIIRSFRYEDFMGYARAYVRAIRTLLKSRRWDFTKTEKEEKEKESQGHTLCSRLDNTFPILTVTVYTLANLMCGKTSISVSDTFNRAFTSLINTEALDSDSILREEGHTAADSLYVNSMLAFAMRSKVSHKLIDNVRHWKRECSGEGCYDAFHSSGMTYPASEIQYINLSGICVHDLVGYISSRL